MRKLCEAGQPIDYSLARREFSHVDTLIVAGKIRNGRDSCSMWTSCGCAENWKVRATISSVLRG